MRMAVFNANGLSGKDPEILDFSYSQGIDVFCIVETWLTPLKTTVIRNPCLNLTHENNEILVGGRRGKGGVLVFTSPDYTNSTRVVYADPANHFAVLKVADLLLGVGYFPPSLDDAVVFAAIDKVLEVADGQDCILMGDFNARMGQFSGDTAVNTRGTRFINYLAESAISLWRSEEGRFTSISSHGGRGVTELVLSNGIEPIEIKVHEENSLGGSDHRPVTFTINTAAARPRAFERWNVRKLADRAVQLAYTTYLRDSLEQALARMRSVEGIDNWWKVLKDWIEAAATASCGRLLYRSTANAAFWTPELLQRKREIINLTQELQQLVTGQHFPPVVRNAAAQELTRKNREYRDLLRERKTEAFQTLVQDLGRPQNAAALMRMVKNTRSQRARTGCKLDPEKLDEYAAHFAQTFGLHPSGAPVSPPQEDAYTPLVFSPAEVEQAMKKVALGKAAGIDGIMGEMYSYGGEPMVSMLHFLFQKISEAATIPSEWQTALIAPVYKQKGSDLDIKNYRPIALIVVARKLYEGLVANRLRPFCVQLNDFQGGFRARRSTLDQCIALNEIMLTRPDLHQVFLDFKAAYDLVDRRVLWARLQSRFIVSWSLIRTIQTLFDNNASIIIVNGSRSAPVPNLRGLLQGSTLSPMLFNFFLDELLELLKHRDAPKLLTEGVRTNALAFADDLNLHARSKEDLQILLDLAEAWSIRVGMRFAPEKCFVFRNYSDAPLMLLGIELPARERIKYLGLNYTSAGIDVAENTIERTANARKVTLMLAGLGMNLTGFPQEASARIYKTFIRPTMEYGLQVRVLPKPQVTLLQKAQNLALRCIFSARRTTSTSALHKLLLIEPMQLRNEILNIKMAGRLLNSTDSSIPAVNLVWNGLSSRRVGSFTTGAMNNKLWAGARIINRIENIRVRGPSVPAETYSKAAFKKLIIAEINSLDNGLPSVAGVLDLLPNKQHFRHALRAGAFTDRKQRVSVLRWLTGGVANHTICLNCPGEHELSRQHAVTCSAAAAMLQERYPGHLQNYSSQNSIDRLLNCFRAATPAPDFYAHIHEAIALIYTRCLGYQQAKNGFWKEPDPSGGAGGANVPGNPNPLVANQAVEGPHDPG